MKVSISRNTRAHTNTVLSIFLVDTLLRLSRVFSPSQFLFLYRNCQRSFRRSCPGVNGIRARGDSNIHADSLDCTPVVDFFDSAGLLRSHPAALISPHAPACTYTRERSYMHTQLGSRCICYALVLEIGAPNIGRVHKACCRSLAFLKRVGLPTLLCSIIRG